MRAPHHQQQPYRGTAATVAAMEQVIRSPRGEMSLDLRMLVEDLVRHVRPKDRASQIAAIYNWFDRRYGYLNDPIEVEQVSDPQRVLEEIETKGRFVGDCDDATVFLVAACRCIGIKAYPVRVGFKAPMAGKRPQFSHVFAVAEDQYGRKLVIDPVAGRHAARMVRRAKQVG